MVERVRVAVVGVGDNVSALVQGKALYRASRSVAGLRKITGELPPTGVTVSRGITDAADDAEVDRVAGELAGAEVVLYAAPSGSTRPSRCSSS
ncbi:hypothetical protein ACWCSD_41530 [Nonomuraea sp. NPDC001684]